MREPGPVVRQKLDRKAAGTASLAKELQSLVPAVEPSPWPAYEWVGGSSPPRPTTIRMDP